MKTNSKLSVYVHQRDCITPLGFGIEKNIEKIEQGISAIHLHESKQLSPTPFYGAMINPSVLSYRFSETKIEGTFSRLEQMMLLSAKSIKKDFGKFFNKRCGLIISSTKGNIDALEKGDISTYYLHQLAQKVGRELGIENEPIVLSNACVSGLMAISVAKRMIHAGKYDHVLLIAGDIFSKFVFSGFQSFQAVANEPCRPYDENRAGITLGEAAASMFVSKDKNVFKDVNCFEVLGEGSINDANHISGPSRTGEGLYRSVLSALKEAGMEATEIDSISAHGTATNYNDEMEAQAFNRLKLDKVPLYSLKGYFGHTLGAAGLLETVIALEFASRNSVPQSIGYEKHGVSLPLNVTKNVLHQEVNVILKTASGFGGSNTAVIFKKCVNHEE